MRRALETTMTRLEMKNIALLLFGFMAASMAIAGCTDLTGPKSPETPVNVTATLLTGTSVRVQWDASPQSDGVISYNIIRNGTKVGETTTTSFTETGLPELTKFEYAVSANCTSGVLSDASPVTASSTVTTPDITPPRVITNQPPNGFPAVSVAATVTATFSEAMDPATINTTTFTLRVTGTGALIPGTVTYTAASRIAEFRPASELPSSTNLTATVSTGAKDTNGNSLTGNFSWAFTTVDVAVPFVIATNPTNGAGGVSTTAPNISVTFSEPMDANTINTASFTLQRTSNGAAVTGTVAYVAATRTASFTPSGALVPGVSYTATVAPSVKDVAGNSLGISFQFSFTTADTNPPTLILTAPANLATGVATNAVVTATFSEAMDQITINATTFTLRVAATSAAVAGTVAYNVATATATFTPTAALSPSTSYIATVTTGAKDLAGNALAASVIPNPWTFTTVDNVPPTVTAVSPPNGATNVSTGTTVNITFSEAMSGTTINGTTITLRNTATSAAVAGIVSFNGTTVATFTPNVALAQGTGYTVTVTTGVRDVAGNAMAAQFTSTFTTVSAPDNTAPTVVSVSPANGSTPPASTKVYVTFSEPMDATTITGTTVTLRVTSPSAAVAGTVSYNAGMNMAIFTPTAPLNVSTGYTVTVTTGVGDVAGNPLAAQFTSAFTTAAVPDATAPTVTGVTPTNGATGVSVSSAVTVTFSEAMDPTTINGTTITLRNTVTSAAVSGTLSHNSATNVATFTPASGLTAGTGYTVTVTTGVRDLAGNAMAAQFTSAFTTAP